MRLYNTLTKKLENFSPIDGKTVRMYNCGPTVYYHLTIGNWRAYIFVDTLRRSLDYLGYPVKQVMNITDVGHLTSDEDEGEDKLEKGAKRDSKTVWEVAQYYIDDFIKTLSELHIDTPDVLSRATDNIPEQIEMIKKIMDNGYAYVTKSAVYFDVLKFQDDFKDYTELSKQPLKEKEVGVRAEVVVDSDKKSPYDFRLWQLDQPDHQMMWDSPWGKGFPGWHIECSAMSVKFLGQPFDIHTGGIDHIPVHHTNEKAQIEAYNNSRFLDSKKGKVEYVQIWMHNEFLTIDGGRMGKSLGNGYTIDDIKKFLTEHLGFESKNTPIALRYLYLTSHYRNKLDFTKESLYNAFHTLFDIYKDFAYSYELSKDQHEDLKANENKDKYLHILKESIENDLDTASVIANLNILFKDNSVSDIDKIYIAEEYDKVLGFGMLENTINYITKYNETEKKLIDERRISRENKDYKESDNLRDELEKLGVKVLDSEKGSMYYRQ